ncbi:CaiB/BaiF CoA transferase family protein [Bradyrhizobium sp. HKCCYLS20291]|uniref:CaiB/BaiF CoA transferase family protein n=1 Tax=Bradyrhizobium sp. HKCCYLS20291 TaxID=3420766 RepID=UPI003EBB2FEE
MNARQNRPLDGITVIDLGQVYQGPYATYLMAKAGANVIKVEPLDGEPVRQRDAVSRGSGAPFAMLNGHKRSMTLNLKSARGREILKALVGTADVLLENFAPGVLDRLGVGWSVLSDLKPRLVYASGSGFGLSGPDKDKLAMDITVQAVSGLMSITGFTDSPPVKAGAAIVDFLAGTHLYAGVVTALYERHFTGRGRLVEVAMQEVVYPTLASNLAYMYDLGQAPPRTGNRHGGLSAAPYNVYRSSDGHVAIIATNEKHWTNLLRAMNRADLLSDPRFSSKVSRVRNMEEVDRTVSEWSSRITRQEACAILDEWKVPSAPVRNLSEVSNDAHMQARGMLTWIDHPQFGRIVIPDSPIRIHGTDRLPAAISPKLGQDTEEILRTMLDFSAEDIEGLRSEGVIGGKADG